jgi:hypothetical protein
MTTADMNRPERPALWLECAVFRLWEMEKDMAPGVIRMACRLLSAIESDFMPEFRIRDAVGGGVEFLFERRSPDDVRSVRIVIRKDGEFCYLARKGQDATYMTNVTSDHGETIRGLIGSLYPGLNKGNLDHD